MWDAANWRPAFGVCLVQKVVEERYAVAKLC